MLSRRWKDFGRITVAVGPVCLNLAAIVAAAELADQTMLREERFDRLPTNWEGVNNRTMHIAPRTVRQDFGPWTRHVGGRELASVAISPILLPNSHYCRVFF